MLFFDVCFFNEFPGLPPRYRDSVRAITPGLPLFLYNYSTHQLHGIFEVCVSFYYLNNNTLILVGEDPNSPSSENYGLGPKFGILGSPIICFVPYYVENGLLRLQALEEQILIQQLGRTKRTPVNRASLLRYVELIIMS